MYGAVRELQGPTGVTHALRGRFWVSEETPTGVVFVKRNTLEMYCVHANKQHARLVLASTASLPTMVLSALVIRRPSAPADLLCLGFSAMRVAVLAWDPSTRDWTTVQSVDLSASINEIAKKMRVPSRASLPTSTVPGEEHRVLVKGRHCNESSPSLRVDSAGRCLAVYADKLGYLVILPVKGDDEAHLGASALGPKSSDAVLQHPDAYIIDLLEEYKVANVKDFTFLDDYFEPTILLLHEPKRTWAGRAAVERNTAEIIAISLDLRKRSHSKTWAINELPYDTMRVIGVPESAGGGVLVLASNVLMQVRHEVCVAGLSLNSFGDAYAAETRAKFNSIQRSKTLMALDASQCAFLDASEVPRVLISLKGGELYFLTLAGPGRSELELVRAGSTVLASAIVPINQRLVVLASRISDSLLIEYASVSGSASTPRDQGKSTNAAEAGASGAETRPGSAQQAPKTRKRKRTAEEEAEYEMLYGTKPPPDSDSEDDTENANGGKLELDENDEGTRGVYDDDDELGAVFAADSGDQRRGSAADTTAGQHWALKVKDTLTCYGPAADMALGRSVNDPCGGLDVVVAGGYAKNGCLAMIQPSIRARDSTQFVLEGYTRGWTLRDPSVARREADARKLRNVQIEAKNADIRASNAKRQAAKARFLASEMDALRPKTPSSGENVNGGREPGAPKNGAVDDSDETPVAERARKKAKADEASSLEEVSIPRRSRPSKQIPENEMADAGRENGDKAPDAESEADKACPNENDYAERVKQIEAEAETRFALEPEAQLEEPVHDETSLHAYLILSNSSNTVAMSTGHDLEQITAETVDIHTQAATVHAANVLDGHAIVQVTSSSVRVLKGGKLQTELALPADAPSIVHADTSDPFVLLLSANGTVTLLRILADTVKASAHGAEAVDGVADAMESQYDEYGMVVDSRVGKDSDELDTGPGEQAGGSGTSHSDKSRGADDSLSMHDDFVNFRIVEEFSSRPSSTGQRAACASVCRGRPARLSVCGRQTIATSHTEGDVAREAGRTELQSDGVSSKGNGEPNGQPQDEPVVDPNATNATPGVEGDLDADDVDEEERMLYGDGGGADSPEHTGNGDAEQNKQRDGATSTPDLDGVGGGSTTPADAAVPASEDERARLGNAGETGVVPLFESSAAEKEEHCLIALATRDGALEIRSSAAEYAVVFRSSLFFLAPSLVVDEGVTGTNPEESGAGAKAIKAKKKDRIVSLMLAEVAGSVLMPGLRSTILVAVQASGYPLVYSAFSARDTALDGVSRSRLRFRRIFAPTLTAGMLAKVKEAPEGVFISSFKNVGGRGGIVVGGCHPFLIFAERGFPRLHPLRLDANVDSSDDKAGVTAFAELHNVNCPRGFVYALGGGLIGVSELPSPTSMMFDAPMPFRKISLRCTPHKVAYHSGSSTYGVLASMPTLTTREERLARILQSLEKHDKRHYQTTVAQAEAETGDDHAQRVPPLFEELHELRVYRPDGWQLIKSYKLKKGEVGLSIANIKVDVYKQRSGGSGGRIPSTNKGEDGRESLFAASLKLRPKNMLVVGTGYLNGEDATSRGRLLLFEISRQEVFSDASGGYTAFQLQLIAEKELPGPVTAVASMEGYVAAGVGPQLGVYKLVQDEIVHLSFAFGQLFCTSIASAKQYIVSADMYKSVAFHFFRDRNASVNFLGKDYCHAASYATEFLIDGDGLSILLSDAHGNVHMFNHANAQVPESRGGKRLLLMGGIQYGSRINRFLRIRCRSDKSDTFAGRHATLFVTLDGGIGVVSPISAQEYEVIERLSKTMLNAQDIARHGQLDPLDARVFRPANTTAQILKQCLIDCRVAMEVFDTGPALARRAAISAETTLGDVVGIASRLDGVLAELERSSVAPPRSA